MVSSGRKVPSPMPETKPRAAMADTALAYQASSATSEKDRFCPSGRPSTLASMAQNWARVMGASGRKVPSS